MFSKLMKKTIAVAAIAAMTSVMAAVATPWWSIDFNSYTDEAKVSASTETQGTWTQQEDDLSVVTSQSLSLNTQGEDLLWTPNAPAESYDSVILDADVKFVASDVEPTTDNSMQTAIYLKATDDGDVLCAYQATENGAAWEALEGFTIADGDTKHVTITIDYNDETPMVTLAIDGTSVEYPVANVADKVSSVAFRGTGVVDNFTAQTSVNVTYVADVDGVNFETYAAALAYVAANGGTLKITGDSAEELSFGELTFTQDATIDLGGKEITASFVVDNGVQFSIDNGTVTAPEGKDVIKIVDGMATVGADAILYASTDCCVYLNDKDADSQLALDVYGQLYVTNDTGYAAIYGNGNNVAESTINIFDDAVVSHDYDLAIYHAQVGTLTIEAATIVGTTGIEMRAGNLVVNEGAIIEGTAEFSATPNGNGSTVLGAAIALSQHTTEQPTSVTVNGGTLKGERAFYQDNLASGTSTSVSATIAAGTTLDGVIEVAEEGFVMPEAEDGSYTLATADFVVAGMPYDTFADAYAAAAEDATIEVYTDFAASEIITIAKGITIDGNGHTLTSTAPRAINIDTTGTVVINDLTIVAKGERAVNIINQASTVTLNNVTASAKNYAVNLATSAAGAKLTVNDSDLTGLAVVNVAAPNADVEINNTNITNVDANANEYYGAISTYKTATGATVVVNGGKVVVADDSAAAFNATADSSIVFNGTEGVDKIVTAAAYIGDAGFETLQEAIEYAKAGQTIILNAANAEDVAISGTTTINLNGYAATGTFTLTDAAAKLNAAQGLKVVTNVEGYEVVFADGCYSVQEKVVEVEFAAVKTTSIVIDGNTAKLTIGGEYTEVKVYFKETLDAEWTEVKAEFAEGVATVPATTATGFFTVHAR